MSSQHLFVEVSGMTCGGCVAALRNALVRGGLAVADLEVGRVRVEVTEPDTEAEVEKRVREAIIRAGFAPGEIRAVAV